MIGVCYVIAILNRSSHPSYGRLGRFVSNVRARQICRLNPTRNIQTLPPWHVCSVQELLVVSRDCLEFPTWPPKRSLPRRSEGTQWLVVWCSITSTPSLAFVYFRFQFFSPLCTSCTKWFRPYSRYAVCFHISIKLACVEMFVAICLAAPTAFVGFCVVIRVPCCCAGLAQ